MYPEFNVNGVGATGQSRRSNHSNRSQRENDNDIQVFNFSNDDENPTVSKLRRTRELADEAAENTKSHMEKIRNYMKEGLSMSEAIQLVEDEEGGVSRETLISRLVKQGFDEETADRLIPRNIDDRIEYAREEGRIAGERRVQEFNQKINNIRNGR